MGVIVLVGLVLFKYIPMQNYGNEILFDASAHVVIAIFILYLGWFFIPDIKKQKKLYFCLSLLILFLVSIQRIYVGEHNFIGVLKGIGIGVVGILITNVDKLKN